MSDRSQGETALVQFSERLTNSAAFGTLFREGMDLVEETAAYLDGDGRTEAKALERSAMVNALTPHSNKGRMPAFWAPAYDEQIIARPRPGVQPQDFLWFPADAGPKKEPPFPAAFEVDNREASNRVDRSHSVSKRGQSQS